MITINKSPNADARTGSQFRRKMKEKTYIVTVLRTGYAHRDIEISATSETEMRTKAENVAGNYDLEQRWKKSYHGIGEHNRSLYQRYCGKE